MKLEKKYEVTLDMRNSLEQLLESSNNPDKHFDIWAESLHLFPEKWKPPLLLNKTFNKVI
jgi:hypothetical protein